MGQLKSSPSCERPLVLHVRSVCGFGGGPEKTILNSPRFLDSLGYDSICAYLHPRKDPDFAAIRERAGRLNAPLVSVPERGALDWRVVRELVRLCRKEKPAIWHGHGFKSDVLGLLVRCFCRMKLVATAHGWVNCDGRNPLYYRIDKRCLRHYHAVICVSEDIFGECLRKGVSRSKCHLIHNGIDTEEFQKASARSAGSRGSDSVSLGAMGRLADEKGFDLLMRATDVLLQEGKTISLRIAGDGPARGRLEELRHSIGRNGEIQLLGHVSDVKAFYRDLDLFVLSSLREGLPNVLLEAMAMEVPVVATRVAGVPSLIRDGENGLLVESGSVDALVRGIRRLLDNPPWRRQLAEAARKTIGQSYGFENRMRKVVEVYDGLLYPNNPGER